MILLGVLNVKIIFYNREWDMLTLVDVFLKKIKNKKTKGIQTNLTPLKQLLHIKPPTAIFINRMKSK